MYDGLDKVPIDKLNFEQLRERVQVLQDRYEVLLRRFPQLSGSSSSGSEFELDWANIKTPLINALVNKINFTAVQSYDSIIKLDRKPGSDPNNPEDKALIYFYDGLYWYWNGNEWKNTPDRNIYSVFNQTPAGFNLEGVLEVKSDTDGRLTISDSFIKMFPAGKDDPKIQFGYDDNSENKEPVILLGAGSSTVTSPIMGYPVRNGQGIVIKTAKSIVFGMVDDGKIVDDVILPGTARYIELRSHGEKPWVYYNDGTADMKMAVDVDINNIQQQINTINNTLSSIQSQINALSV